MATKTLGVRLKADIKDFTKGINTAEKSLLKSFGRMSTAGKRLSIGITAPVAAASFAVLKLGDAAVKTDRRFGKVFGASAASAAKQLQNFADATGESREALRGFAANNQDVLQGLGLAKDQAAELSIASVKMATDLAEAAGSSVSLEQAQNAVSKAMTGSFESLQSLGIKVTEQTLKEELLAQGRKEQLSDLSQAEKAELALAAVRRQATSSVGAAAQAGRDASNVLAELTNKTRDLGADVGKTLLPALVPLLDKIISISAQIRQLNPSVVAGGLAFSGMAAALGPVLFGLGQAGALVTPFATGLVRLAGTAALSAKALLAKKAATDADTLSSITNIAVMQTAIKLRAKQAVAVARVAAAQLAAAGPVLVVVAALESVVFGINFAIEVLEEFGIGADQFRAAWEAIKDTVGRVGDFLKGVFDATNEKILGFFREVRTKLGEFTKFFADKFIALGDTVLSVLEFLGIDKERIEAFRKGLGDLAEAGKQALIKGKEKIVEGVEAVAGAIAPIGGKIVNAAKDAAIATIEQNKAALGAAGELVTTTIGAGMEAGLGKVDDVKAGLQARIDELQALLFSGGAAGGAGAGAGGGTGGGAASAPAAPKADSGSGGGSGGSKNIFDRFAAAAANFGDSLKEKVNDKLTQTIAFADLLSDSISKVADSFVDSLFAGEDFGDSMKLLAKDVIKQFSAMIIKALLLKAVLSGLSGFGSALSGAFGGAGGAAAGAGAQLGGKIPEGGIRVVGEAGPELVSGPANVLSRAGTRNAIGGGQPVIVQVINNSSNSTTRQEETTGPDGQRVIRTIVEDVISRDIARNGNISRSLTSNLTARRRAS